MAGSCRYPQIVTEFVVTVAALVKPVAGESRKREQRLRLLGTLRNSKGHPWDSRRSAK
jgi:hypothetical protein